MLLPTCSIGFNINYGRACGTERLDFFLPAPRRSVGWQRADAIAGTRENQSGNEDDSIVAALKLMFGPQNAGPKARAKHPSEISGPRGAGAEPEPRRRHGLGCGLVLQRATARRVRRRALSAATCSAAWPALWRHRVRPVLLRTHACACVGDTWLKRGPAPGTRAPGSSTTWCGHTRAARPAENPFASVLATVPLLKRLGRLSLNPWAALSLRLEH